MASKIFALVLLGAASASSLVAVGCASGTGQQPYSLTGKTQEQIDQDHQEWLHKQQYTDQKGRYHPEWDRANHATNQ
jgi:hypothetical protein